MTFSFDELRWFLRSNLTAKVIVVLLFGQCVVGCVLVIHWLRSLFFPEPASFHWIEPTLAVIISAVAFSGMLGASCSASRLYQSWLKEKDVELMQWGPHVQVKGGYSTLTLSLDEFRRFLQSGTDDRVMCILTFAFWVVIFAMIIYIPRVRIIPEPSTVHWIEWLLAVIISIFAFSLKSKQPSPRQ